MSFIRCFCWNNPLPSAATAITNRSIDDHHLVHNCCCCYYHRVDEFIFNHIGERIIRPHWYEGWRVSPQRARLTLDSNYIYLKMSHLRYFISFRCRFCCDCGCGWTDDMWTDADTFTHRTPHIHLVSRQNAIAVFLLFLSRPAFKLMIIMFGMVWEIRVIHGSAVAADKQRMVADLYAVCDSGK